MSRAAERAFYTGEARRAVADAVKRVEAETAAEVVVAVRRRSSAYRDADYLFGLLVALGVLGALLFAPQQFAVETMPLDVLLAFVAGAVACARSPLLTRAFSRRARRDAEVATRARATFVDDGVSRTRHRSGILIYVSLLERRVEVVFDVGFDQTMRAALAPTVAALDGALRPRPDFARLVAALDALAAPLARAWPAGADKTNELPDEPDEPDEEAAR